MRVFLDCLVLCLLSCALLACAQTRQVGQSSETHFLATCTSDDCGSGLSCVCGVCTETCDENASCGQHASNAQCEPTEPATCSSAAEVCDVTCESDGDCESLGSEHACEVGRCRAPLLSMVGDGDAQDAGRIDIASCKPEDVAAYLLDDQELTTCVASDADAGISVQDQARCVTTALSMRKPFYVSWNRMGIDSLLTSGYLGRQEASGFRVYQIGADSLGTDRLGETWFASWAPCAPFAVDESCSVLEECFSCVEVEAELCGCQLEGDSEPRIACVERDTLPCEASSCMVDDTCVPSGWASDDGCCSCDDGDLGCINPAWCPGPITIGRRCETDAQCQLMGTGSDLHCRTDFAGERGVCTRACNFGCPEGTECVAQVPHYNEGFVPDMCMRPCSDQAQCDEAMSEEGASECDAPGGLSQSYCF